MKRIVVICAVVSMFLAGSFAEANTGVFGLDDNPTTPLNPNNFYDDIGLGAEDPFGLGTFGAGGLAPSPSLGVGPFADADLLEAGLGFPALHVITPDGYWISAFSDNTQVYSGPVKLDFSVDRISMGASGTAVNNQYLLNQQPGDIFRTNPSFPSPGNFVGTLQPNAGFTGSLGSVGAGGSNKLVLDESALTLTAMGTPGVLIGPSSPAMPIGSGTHDNVDSFEWNAFDTTGDRTTDNWMYFSIYPVEAVMVNVSAADIYDVKPGEIFASPTSPFALASTLGLDMLDDIDALILYDLNMSGSSIWGGPGAEPGIDYALFSLSHGSASLSRFGLSPADIFFTDFSGSFSLYASAANLGLQVKTSRGGNPDNVDALEIVPEPTTIALLGLGGLALLRKRRA